MIYSFDISNKDLRKRCEEVIMEDLLFLHRSQAYEDHDFKIMLQEHDILTPVFEPYQKRDEVLLRFLSDDLLRDLLIMVKNVVHKFKQCYGID